jgi:hypothetical protein
VWNGVVGRWRNRLVVKWRLWEGIVGRNRYVVFKDTQVMGQWNFVPMDDVRWARPVRLAFFEDDVPHLEYLHALRVVNAIPATSHVPNHCSFPSLLA